MLWIWQTSVPIDKQQKFIVQNIVVYAHKCMLLNKNIFKAYMYVWDMSFQIVWEKKKEEIWLSPMTKAPTPTEKSKKQSKLQHKNVTKSFDYTTIADRLRTVSFSNNSHQTGVVKPVYRILTFPLTATVEQNYTNISKTFENLIKDMKHFKT